MMNRIFTLCCKRVLIFLSVSLMVLPVQADDGRYQAVVLHEGGGAGQSGSLIPKVFVIDSQEGHMWLVEQNTKLHRPKGDFSLGTVITYQGQVRPGKTVGEIVGQGTLLK